MLILDNKSSHDEGKRETENDKDTDNEKEKNEHKKPPETGE